MKQYFSLILAFACAISVFGQAPTNDDCTSIIDLGIAPFCPDTVIYTNTDATPSFIGANNVPSCFNSVPQRDVWFVFTCSDTLLDYRVTLTGVGTNSIVNPEMAIYRGDCTPDGFDELACISAPLGESTIYIDLFGLTIGAQYYLRINDYSATGAPESGDFKLCIDKIPPVNTIDQGGSTLCSGTLMDTGGATNDYGPNEDNTFVICPPSPTGCLTFTLDQFNIDAGTSFGPGNDILTFYDGNSTSSPILSQLNSFDVDGGGGVCMKIQASSGCMTVAFQTDDIVEFEGFIGHWQCSLDPCEPIEPVAINTSITADSIVNSVSTPFTTVTVTDIRCPNGAYGTFSYANDVSDLGLKKGLLLTTGDASLATGPNQLSSSGLDNHGPQDADLTYLAGATDTTRNACVVELDVFVATDELSFEYVFGSDEYPEFANSNYNDIFALLVSGPGIVGDPNLTNSAKNIATLPVLGNPVSINNVNNVNNWQFYRNNQIGQSLEYDGLTSDLLGLKKSLTAKTSVIPCNTYHLKFAIADRFDGVYDSGVFVSEIKGGTPHITSNFASGIDYLTESCSNVQDELLFTLNEAQEDTISFYVTISGTAQQGIDYTLTLPAVITFLPGQTSFAFPITPIADGLTEGDETITLTLSNNFGCGTVIYETKTFILRDNLLVDINAGADTVFVCAGTTAQLQASGAGTYLWSPANAVSNAIIPNPTITPTGDIQLIVTGTLNTCVDMDTVNVKVISPEVSVSTTDPVTICQGTSVQLNVVDNVQHQGLVWTPAAGLNNPNSANPIATPSQTTTYKAVISLAGCTVEDTITIFVDTLFFPVIPQTIINTCQNYPVVLASDENASTTDYSWMPSLGLDDASISNPTALPDQSTVYTLTATSAHGYCTQTATVTVNVTAADLDLLGDAYREMCLGDTFVLNAITNPSGPIIHWSPNNGSLNTLTGTTVIAQPEESQWVFASYDINGCSVTDSMYIRVDSLPLLDIKRVLDKPIYCPGDTVYLISKTYDPASFPDISHIWEPYQGQLTDLDLWNMVIQTSTTHTFVRISSNHACQDTAIVEIPVYIPPTITVTGVPMSVCPGQPVSLNAVCSDPLVTLVWKDDPTLSCTECPNPTATPSVTTTYTVMADGIPCPASTDYTVIVNPVPVLGLANNPTICAGDQIQLNSISEPGVTYSWTAPGFTSSDPLVVVNPSVTTTYHLVASIGDCTIEGDVMVTVVVKPIVNIISNTTICAGESIQLSTFSEPDVTYTWAAPGFFSTDPNVTVMPSSTTTYTFTASRGNCISSGSVTITVTPLPTLNLATNPTICVGDGIQLNTVSEPGVTYTWTAPGGFTSNDPLVTVTPAVTTTYSIEANNAGCKTLGTVTVTVVPKPVINIINNTTICAGQSIQLSTFSEAGVSYSWVAPGGFSSNDPTVTVSPTQSTMYTLTASVGNCSSQGTVFISVLPSPSLNVVNDQTICPGDDIQLNTISEAGVTYLWTATGFNSANPTVTVTPAATTTYHITATLQTCVTKDSVTITVAKSTLDAGDDETLCLGSSIDLTATVTGDAGTFNWAPTNETTPTITVQPNTTTTYTVTYVYSSANCILTDDVKVTVVPSVVLDSLIGDPMPDDTLCQGQELKLTLKVVQPASAQLSWSYNGEAIPGTGKSITHTPTVPPGTPAVYTVTATAANGCTNSISVTYGVMKCWFLPNAFTPGDGGKNDLFGLEFFGDGKAEIKEFQVYSRWGERVFESTPTELKWDGTVNGKDAPSDVYVYKIIFTLADGSEVEKAGDILLLR